jgi:integrase
MSSANPTPARRVKIEPGIYRRHRDGKLEIGFRDSSGRQRWRGPFSGLRAARKALAEEHARRGRGEMVADDPQLRFNAAADAWWTARVVKLRPRTQSIYASNLKHLREHFGNARMVTITPTMVASYITAKQAEGLKGWTLRGHLTVLSAVFVYAARHLGMVGQNPCGLLDAVERPSIEDASPARVLDGRELARLLAAIEERYRLLFTVAAQSGARLGEVLGLAWQDVEFDGQTLTFTHQLGRDRQRHPLKTKRSRRTIEIAPSLVSELRRAKLASPKSGDHDLVFLSRRATPHDHRNIARILARAVKRAGLGAIERDGQVVVPAPSFHDLRHSHASALIAEGWPVTDVSARLGHASATVTMTIYAHAIDCASRSQDRRDKLAKLYAASS